MGLIRYNQNHMDLIKTRALTHIASQGPLWQLVSGHVKLNQSCLANHPGHKQYYTHLKHAAFTQNQKKYYF